MPTQNHLKDRLWVLSCYDAHMAELSHNNNLPSSLSSPQDERKDLELIFSLVANNNPVQKASSYKLTLWKEQL